MHRLTVDEQSTYIDVICDGYRLRINNDYTAGSSDFIEIRDAAAGTTEYAKQRFYADFDAGHFVRVGWDASNRLFIEVDGELTEQTSGVDAAPTLDTNMFFTADDASGTNRANIMMGDVIITDDIDTPDLWSAFGKPKLIPLLEVTE